jgi:hypothetical protein
VFGAAIAAFFQRGPLRGALGRFAVVGVALLLTVRFHTTRIFNNWYRGHLVHPPRTTAADAQLMATPRILATNQEQHRLNAAYAVKVGAIAEGIESANWPRCRWWRGQPMDGWRRQREGLDPARSRFAMLFDQVPRRKAFRGCRS